MRPTTSSLRCTGLCMMMVLASLLVVTRVSAQSLESFAIDSVHVLGAHRTSHSTLLELLPRPAPSVYTSQEIEEIERRITNLAIFEAVSVERSGRVMIITVEEKWTLIPAFDLALGNSWADLYLELGATEYNFLGTGSALGLRVYREQRGIRFSALFEEHEYRLHRWALGVETAYAGSSVRDSLGSGWIVDRATLQVWTTSPPVFSPFLRWRVGMYYGSENVTEVVGEHRPPNGHAFQPYATLMWDRYRFDDLTPSGVRVHVSAGPGLFLPVAQARHFAELELRAAQPILKLLTFTQRVRGAITTRGNTNNSYLVGSYQGVRGLPDALYRNWAQVFVNAELRYSLRLFAGWYVQTVAFVDAACFAQLSLAGEMQPVQVATSVGTGIRIVPRFLANLLLRFDVARLLLPEQLWFPQFGLRQYF